MTAERLTWIRNNLHTHSTWTLEDYQDFYARDVRNLLEHIDEMAEARLVVIQMEGGIILETFTDIDRLDLVVVDNDYEDASDQDYKDLNYFEDIAGGVYHSKPSSVTALHEEVCEAIAIVKARKAP